MTAPVRPTPGGHNINTSNTISLAGIRVLDPDGATFDLDRLAGSPTVVQLVRYFG